MGKFLDNGQWVSEVPGSKPEGTPTNTLKDTLTKWAQEGLDVYSDNSFRAYNTETWDTGYDAGYRQAMQNLLAQLEVS